MLEDNVLTGFPKHEKGIFKSALDDLVKKGVVCIKKIAHGDAFYIDPKQRVKVKNVLKKYYPFL